MTVQLELQMAERSERPFDAIVAVARTAIDLSRLPGYAAFTSGSVLVERADSRHIVLLTDGPWAASAVRTALLDAGCAVDADLAHEAHTVTAWSVRAPSDALAPELRFASRREEAHLGVTFLLKGPDGVVEQQCGTSGYNDLIVHAFHPFPGSLRVSCPRHLHDCWQRTSWSFAGRVRHLIANVILDDRSEWSAPQEAVQRMRSLYQTYIHQTRPDI